MKAKVYVINQDTVSDGFILVSLIFGLGFWLGAKWKEKQKKESDTAEGS